MDSLFDQLKSEPPVELIKKDETTKATKRSPSPPVSIEGMPTPNKIKKPTTPRAEKSVVRRESMPPPVRNFVTNSVSKSRSLSPPKGVLVKPFKVLLERKKMEELIDGKSHKVGKLFNASASQKVLTGDDRIAATLKNGEETPKKSTPTKAQQKLFDPAVLVKAQQLTQLKVKRCKVRLMRQDLSKLQREFYAKKITQKKKKKLNKQSSPKNADKNRRGNSSSPAEKSSPKRGRFSSDANDSKQSTGFFIKLNALTKTTKSKSSAGSIAKRVNAAAAISSTKPTKFTRTQLIKMYGKRVFCSRIKIERCSHPMMLIFESNARARRLQTKRSKSKNLSVSFREQVEIFGDSSDSEEVDISQMFDVAVASTSQAAMKSANSTNISLTATPARLKKVENGKVIDDIELDPSLFVAPAVSSTPYTSSGRKKREKKSFSPLKGDGSPSPRKEQLKLANEKMPPSSLRRLTVDDVDEEDDEDDECEYIVPIEIPERRISRTSSGTAVDDAVSEQELQEPVPTELESTPVVASQTLEAVEIKSSVHDSSGESFASAVEQPAFLDKSDSKELCSEKYVNMVAENVSNGAIANSAESEKTTNDVVSGEKDDDGTESVSTELPKLVSLDSVSPSQSLTSLNDIVDSLINNVHESLTANNESANVEDADSKTNNGLERDTNDKNMSDEHSPGKSKLCEPLDDNISLQLFVDEESAIKNREIVDDIVQERVDEISKDKQLSPPNKSTAILLSSKVTAE